MREFLMSSRTVARRDFMAIVATPSFLLFLLAPLFFIALGAGSAIGTQSITKPDDDVQLLVLFGAADNARVKAVDGQLRKTLGDMAQPPTIGFRTATGKSGETTALMNANGAKLQALLHGNLAAPTILERTEGSKSAAYLAYLVERARQADHIGTLAATPVHFKTMAYPPSARTGPKFQAAKAISLGAITAIFMLTLLLATQSISSIAEEKSNKVIEILAAAVPLESVFVGKLLAMLAVGLLFILFWGLIAALGGAALAVWAGPMASSGEVPFDADTIRNFAPAVGWPTFGGLTLVYMITNFLLYGSLFLGLGSLAATTREIQMLSFPVTILQMFAYFVPLANLRGDGSGALQRFAEIFPFTSPYSMVAKAATDSDLGWHFVAIGWQAIWVAIVIFISVRLFRSGVLGGERRWKFWRRAAA